MGNYVVHTDGVAGDSKGAEGLLKFLGEDLLTYLDALVQGMFP